MSKDLSGEEERRLFLDRYKRVGTKKKGWKIISGIAISIVLVLVMVCIWHVDKVNQQAEEIEVLQVQKEFLLKLIFSEEVPYLDTWEKYGEEVLAKYKRTFDFSWTDRIQLAGGPMKELRESSWYNRRWSTHTACQIDIDSDNIADYWERVATHIYGGYVFTFYDMKPTLRFVLVAFPKLIGDESSKGDLISYYREDSATGKIDSNSVVGKFGTNYLLKAWEKSEEGWKVVLEPTIAKNVQVTVLKENEKLKFELEI